MDTILTGLAAPCERACRPSGNFLPMRSERRHARLTTLFAAGALLACGGDPPPPAEEAKAPEVAVAESSLKTFPVGGASCPLYGLWRASSVEDRIGRAGLAVNRREEGVTHDFLNVDGLVWETSRAEVQVFLYASEADRKRDTDALDTVFVAPPGKRIMWRWPATLVTSNNMAAIILSLNGRQAERIALALGAGLPPAPR
jgi:hypothetical protein